MSPRRTAAVAVAFAVWATGCAAQNDGLDKQLATMRTELAGLRAENAQLAERLDKLEIKGGGLKGYEAPSAAPGGADSDRPDLAVVKLTPNASPGDAAPPPEDGPRTIIRTTPKGTVVEETYDGKTPAGGGDAGADFAKAKEQFEKKSWGDALTGFSAFVVKYPDHPKVMDATYYAGNAAYQKGDYARAVELLTKVSNATPGADKAPDALYDLGRAYEKLGEKDKAADARKRLKADFPKSAAAKKLNS